MKNRNADGTVSMDSAPNIWDNNLDCVALTLWDRQCARRRKREARVSQDNSRAQSEMWARVALQYLRSQGAQKGTDLIKFTVEDVEVSMLNAGLPAPEDARAWGTVFQSAKRDGLITQLRVDGEVVTKPTAAKHRTPVWIFRRD